MSNALHTCSVCGSAFDLRFAYQMLRSGDTTVWFCGQTCHERYLFSAQQKTCCVCSTQFDLQYAFQQSVVDNAARYFCTTVCRERELNQNQPRSGQMRRIAVLNQKGGTGKTTTSVNVAAGLAEAGHKTLLIDLDAQGNVAVSLGLNTPKTIADVLLGNAEPADCIVPVSPNLDALTSNTALAHAEVQLVQMRDRHKVLRHRMRNVTQYDYVVMDCGPSLSVLNQNALVYADHILIPVSCDYLSLVGVRQILKTLKQVNDILLHPVSILGVVPTFYDVRTRISVEAVQTLQAYFKDRVLPPIRVNTRLKEAPSHKKTVFEFAPDSHGAEDYRTLVQKVIELSRADAAHYDGEAAFEQPGA